jgi:arylsulfatase A-like enzyme
MRSLLPSLLLTLGLAACSSPEPAPVAAPEPVALDLSCPGCNVVLLNIGNLRADRLGAVARGEHLPDRSLTQQIDRFFEPGASFEQASSPAGATYYAATAIATGTEAMLNTHQMREEDAQAVPNLNMDLASMWLEGGGRWLVLAALEREGELLVDKLPTIAQVLAAAGYHTSAVNDWIHTGMFVGLDRGFEEYIDLTDTSVTDANGPVSTMPISLQVELVLEALQSHRELRPQQPLYLYFHPNTLHFPYPQPDRPGEMIGKRADHALFQQAYERQVVRLDQALRPVFEELGTQGWLEDTVVVLYSNHGLELGERGIKGMGRGSQACVHTPLLIRHPRIQEPVVISHPVSLVDLAPTLYEILGIEQPPPTLAHSLTPLMGGAGRYQRELILGKDIQEEYVRRGDWKLIVDPADGGRLHDLATDPREEHDLAAERQDIVAELTMALESERLRQLAFSDELEAGLAASEAAP